MGSRTPLLRLKIGCPRRKTTATCGDRCGRSRTAAAVRMKNAARRETQRIRHSRKLSSFRLCRSRAARSRTSERLAYQTRQVTGPSSTKTKQAVEESNPAREDLETKLCPAPDLRAASVCGVMDPAGVAPAPSCLQGRRSPTRATSPDSAEPSDTKAATRSRGRIFPLYPLSYRAMRAARPGFEPGSWTLIGCSPSQHSPTSCQKVRLKTPRCLRFERSSAVPRDAGSRR